MHSKTCHTLLCLFLVACNVNSNGITDSTEVKQTGRLSTTGTNPYDSIAAIPLPAGYHRFPYQENSFGAWLRRLELKNDKTVYLFNGDKKLNQTAQFAVLDISTGDKNLQQCADAVMRLRAEYLFASGQPQKISFTDNAGGVYQFNPPYSKERLLIYLQRVFGMCGSASLSKQLKAVKLSAVQPGDVLIRGGFPGHAVIVMDVAVDNEGKKIILLAQSYMPAQDIHVLINPASTALSPWYEVNEAENIITPEYIFNRQELKTW
jgi:hypothetical protein